MPAELLPLPPRMLRLGMTLPYDIYDAAGKLMFARGQVLRDSPLVRSLINGGAWVQPEDTAEYQKALAHRMDTLMHQDAVLSEIAGAEVQFRFDPQVPKVELPPREAWSDLLLHTHLLLRDHEPAGFELRLRQLRDQLLMRTRTPAQTDATLLQLVFETGLSFQDYSARHALLTLLLADLVASQLALPDGLRASLHGAALTMNYGAGPAHDRLAAQAEPASPAQRQAMSEHGHRAARRLQDLGVTDPVWLDAVRLHHEAGPGPLAPRPPGEQIARLLRRIDIYGAKLAPRRSRLAMSAAAAARAVYLDEMQQPDEAGAALIKAVGLYPPGSVVRLADGEIGMVFRRGYSANEPLVAALIGRSGAPLSTPIPRDTRQAAHAIAASLAPQDLKLRVNLDAVLRL